MKAIEEQHFLRDIKKIAQNTERIAKALEKLAAQNTVPDEPEPFEVVDD